MAKSPTAPSSTRADAAKPKPRRGQSAAAIAGKDMGGESVRKAPVFPADAPIMQSYGEDRGTGGETHQAGAGHAPLTLRATKEGLRRLAEGAADPDDDLILSCYMSEDFREGMDAFLNKRTPQWKGR